MFNNPNPPAHNFNAMEVRLSASFRAYWTSLAAFGDPNHNLTPDQVVWPTFNTTTQAYVHMRSPVNVDTFLEAAKCAFWSTRYTKYYFD